MYTRIYEYSEGTKKRFRVIGFKGYRPMPGGDRAEPSEHDFKLDESLCRSRRNIRDIILCNRFVYFCTFTFSDCKTDRSDLDALSYVSKYITKDLISVMKGAHLYFSSKGLRRPSLVFDEDNVPFPMKPQYSDEFCKLSWASGGDVIGDLLPSWYDDMCADIRDIDSPERLTERALFSELTVEQLSLLESAEQVPVPWDM